MSPNTLKIGEENDGEKINYIFQRMNYSKHRKVNSKQNKTR